MSGQEIVELIGSSINDPKVKDAMKFFALSKPKLSGYGSVMVYGKKNKVSFEFRPRVIFEREYLVPPHNLVPDWSIDIDDLNPNSENMELYLQSVSFSKTFIEGLPFGLKANDTNDTYSKLGKSYSKEKLLERYAWCFLSDKHQITIYLDNNKKFDRLSVYLIDNEIRKSQKRKETIKTQNKNIVPLLDEQIEFLKSQMPTILWKQRMIEGDEFFTNENLQQSETLLVNLLNSLQLATNEKKANKILSAIKVVVIGFNKLNDFRNYIDTQEREELCDFINKTIQSTGFEIDENEDITNEWRKW